MKFEHNPGDSPNEDKYTFLPQKSSKVIADFLLTVYLYRNIFFHALCAVRVCTAL